MESGTIHSVEVSGVLNLVRCYCFVYCVQSELVIQELKVAIWAKPFFIIIPNADRSVIFKMDEACPQASRVCDVLSSKVFSLSVCFYSLKKPQTKLIMLLGLVNKLMCTKSFRRNQSMPVTGSEIPVWVRHFAAAFSYKFICWCDAAPVQTLAKKGTSGNFRMFLFWLEILYWS